jgi:hypothetical protein
MGADVFVSEATWQDGRELPFHMTARQAGEHAARAGARKLVLTHGKVDDRFGRSGVTRVRKHPAVGLRSVTKGNAGMRHRKRRHP